MGPQDRRQPARAHVVGVSMGGMIAQSLKLGQMVQQEKAQLTEENTLLKRELQQKYDFRNIVGTSKEMREVYEQVAQVAHVGGALQALDTRHSLVVHGAAVQTLKLLRNVASR